MSRGCFAAPALASPDSVRVGRVRVAPVLTKSRELVLQARVVNGQPHPLRLALHRRGGTRNRGDESARGALRVRKDEDTRRGAPASHKSVSQSL